MLNKARPIDRERIAGAIIFICLFFILLTTVGIRLLDVKVLNIELVDRGLYSIITDYGPINVSKDDLLRIERTYTKAAITGTPVELDRIYTTKGFIYISSLDSFYQTGCQLINSVDFVGKPLWIRPSSNEITESTKTTFQLQNDNFKAVQPFSYAIGTPAKLASLVFSILSLQYLAFAIGGLALMLLIFPLKLQLLSPRPNIQDETEYCSSEENATAVAK